MVPLTPALERVHVHDQMSEAVAQPSPSVGPTSPSSVSRFLRASGRGIALAYRSMDADIPRHLAELPLVGLTVLGPRRPPLVALPDDGHRPVVFVHGLGGHRGNFLLPRLFLRLHGRTRTYAVGFPPRTGIEGQAVELSRVIAEVAAVNGLPQTAQVDVVAHSMGGLIARLCLEDPATRARVATVVTMGTPHAGTHAARYGQSATIRALRPDSDLMRRLEKQLPWTGTPRLVSFWSESDLFLLPASSGLVDGAENVEVEGLTHYGYLLRPACFRRLAEALSG